MLSGASLRPATAQERPRPDTLDPPPLDTTRTEGRAPIPQGPPTIDPDVGQRLVSDTMTTLTTEAPPDTGIVSRYLSPTPRRPGALFDTRSPLLGPRSPVPSADAVTLDSTADQYRLDDTPYTDGPMTVDTESYRRERYRANRQDNWTSLVEQRQQQRTDRGGLGVNMTVPGGRESAFTTIFGKPQVDLRLNGQADVNAGFEYSKNDQQGARTGDATQLDPSFKQDLRLGITGTIGDKLTINVDWDTNNQFDYQNQVKLKYEGYDDEIIQSIEAGNVFMEPGSKLISGGQSLFGIKGQFQFGNLNLTTIASQQEGQSNSLSIEGGAEETEFNLKPTDYDEDSHFFLGYYFRNNWNRAHQDPTSITLFNGFNRITDIEVWKLQTSTGASEESDVRRAAAVVDLGESPEILRQADGYTNPDQLMGPAVDQYEGDDLTALRDGDQPVSDYVETMGNLDEPLQAQDWESGNLRKLERGRDYQLDGRLGFVSLKQRLRPNEALAVAFRYQAGGQTIEVGDFASSQGGSSGGVTGDRLVLKLLRPTNPVAPGPEATPSEEPTAWFLELRNIYRLAGRGFTAESFDLDIQYSPSGQGTSTTLSEISNDPLLQLLGLDRVNQSGAPTPDNEFDFTAQTIDAEEGLIYFPYLRPFGERILEVAGENGNRSAGQPFAFQNLYVKKKTNAEKEDTGQNVYQLMGTYSGQAKGFYDLKAFTGLVNGSVKVTSGGQTLKEGQDYVVDYQSGTVNITNETYLADGREINISYEQQSVASLQQKTLLGARADWALRDRFSLGATVMRLSEDSPVDKYRIGQEPIKNTIWGVDGSMNLEPQWLTGAVDALPLVETREQSTISLSGEFAQLRPGHTRTEAFEQTLSDVQNSSKDSYASDERNGVSYIDDFEGFENTFSLREQLQAWQVSAAPDSLGPMLDSSTPARTRTWWRGSFGWYQLNEQIKDDLGGKVTQRGNPEATQLFDVQDVFDRDTRGSPDQTLRTLDMYFNPWKRGPYNYLDTGRNLLPFIQNPKKVWGGVTRNLPEGYTDFSVQNVEFVEFIVKPYPQNGDITKGSKLYVNLGTVSEDVVPNQRLNTEDGLSLSFDADDFDGISRIAGGTQNNSVDVRGNVTEDLGLDGLVSYTESGSYDDGLQETEFYSDFVDRADSLQGATGGLSPPQRERLQAELARIQEDPSADDYHHYENDRYFGDASFFPEETTLQERFTRYYAGDELNTFEGQNELAEDVSLRRGISGGPDTEDLSGTGGNANITNNYFRYAVPLDSLEQKAGRDLGRSDYVVSKVGRDRDWYKVRIPVRAFSGRVGNAQDFTRIESIRMWTTGHKAPITVRFASLELVGSQWRTASSVAQQPVESGDVMDEGEGELRVASINNEEDPNYEAPVGAIVSESRTATGVEQRNREQALLLNVNNLEPGRQRGVFKTFQQGLDLLKYSNLRMYTHVHGASNSPQEKERIREHLRLFVRLGANESGDYYEYEQPLTVSNVPGTEGAASLWPEESEMNLALSALSQLKTARDQSGTPVDSMFSSDRVDLPLGFAPDGTTLKIRGTPSLDGVNTAVIGVRHVGAPSQDAPLENVEVWVNELRVSGFDEEGGWATTSSTDIKLADLATVQGSFQRRTDGFGALNSTLDERRQSDNTSWNVRTDFNVDALLPQQQGWDIPVSMQVQSDLTEPRFDPQRGDVRVSEVKEQFDILPDSTIEREFGDQYPNQSAGEIRSTLKDSVQRASETYNFRRTVTANMSKSGSDSWWIRNTVDATSLNFSYFDKSARSPQSLVNDQWSWSSGFQYQLNFGQARTVQPLGFLPEAPVLSTLGGVEFNYVPTSLSFSGDAERSVNTTRSRPTGRRSGSQPTRIANPFRENQNFTHSRNFSLQYDPFGFLGLNFDTNTQQNLNDISSRAQRNLVFSDRSVVGSRVLTDVDTATVFRNPQRFGLPADVSEADLRDALGQTLFVEERLRLKSEQELFQDFFFGDASPRTERYRQRLSATLQLGILDRKALNWISVQDVSYQSSFQWQNGARGSFTGASVQNSVSLRTGASLHPNKVWERFGFYKRMKEAQRSGGGSEDAASSGPSSSGGAEPDTTGQASGENGDAEEDGPGWDDLPLPDPINILRGVALTFMDIRDFTINYNGERSARSSNVGGLQTGPDGAPTGVSTDYSILDAIRGQGPPIGYRLGLQRRIDLEDRVFESGQVVNGLQNRNRFEARTALSPTSSFNVDLNWSVEWSKNPEISLQQLSPGRSVQEGPFRDVVGSGTQRFLRSRTESGSASASVWAFGSYQSFFKKQLAKFRSTPGPSSPTVPDAEEVALTKPSVAADFREAYLTGGGTSVGGNGFAPFPMPNWTVRYSGLSDWPFIKVVTESVSLTHGYSAEYQTGFNSISTAGDTTSITVGNTPIDYVESRFEPQSVQVQEQFQPIIGVDLTWPFGLETSVEWNRRNTTALRGTNVVERKTSEISGRISYSKRGMDIPFFARIENRLQVSVTLTRSVNDEREFLLNEALQQAQENPNSFDPGQATEGDNVNPLSQTTLLKIVPEISYNVSNRVTARFRLEYEKFDGDNRRPSYTNVNGSFNLSVSISEN